jgi:hypothetical protein
MRFLSPITEAFYRDMSPFKLKTHVRDRMIAELEKMEAGE